MPLPAAALVFFVLRLPAEGLCAISVPAFAIQLHMRAFGQLLCVLSYQSTTLNDVRCMGLFSSRQGNDATKDPAGAIFLCHVKHPEGAEIVVNYS
jgi:hypothetical protein